MQLIRKHASQPLDHPLAYPQETTQLEAVIESLRLERTATVDANQENVQRLEEERQAAEQAAAELRTQVEDLLSNAGTLEHRLVNTQQERDEAVSRSSDLEQEAQRLASDVRKAKEDMAKASGERDAEKEAEDAERVEQKERRKEEIEQLQHALSDRLADLEQLRSEAHENHVQQQEKQQEQDNLLEKSLAEADALRSEVDELRAAAESEALKVEQETDEEGDQTEALEQAARAREEAAAQLAEATGKISELEERVGQLVEELDGVRKAEGEATDQADALKAMVDDMKDDMERERQRAVDLKEERDTAVKDKVWDLTFCFVRVTSCVVCLWFTSGSYYAFRGIADQLQQAPTRVNGDNEFEAAPAAVRHSAAMPSEEHAVF